MPPTPGPRWALAGQGAMGAAALRALLEAPAVGEPVAVLAGEPLYGQRPVAALAEDAGLRVEHVDRVGSDPVRALPEVFGGLEVAVACCWAERLGPDALRAPARGWLNLHPSALPAWRGAEPVPWQLLASPSRIGCSVHRMTEGLDEGPVVADGSVPVGPGDDRGAVEARAGAALGRLAAGLLARMAAGEDVGERAQRHDEATWCPPSGTVPMVDPRAMTAAAAARVARAFSPLPGIAVATLPPEQRLASPEVGASRSAAEQPGTVSTEPDGGIAIACTDRWLRGRLLQPAPDGT